MFAAQAKVIFDSRDSRFKSPSGAVKVGTAIHLSLLLSRTLAGRRISLVMIDDATHETADWQMEPGEEDLITEEYSSFCVDIVPPHRGLYWYYFRLDSESGSQVYGRDPDTNRAIPANGEPISWQLTVYDREYAVPDWIYGGVYYHIFVDRFRKSGQPVYMHGKVTRGDWGGQPVYRPDENGRILNNDFFGGNLQGIREKLPYLRSLGVTCLYLSPICEAYSNHKYDTGDYLHIDPMFGTEDDFVQLCQKAEEYGIRVLCDGVFSHTGDDSIYFDKYGHYGGRGAWKNPDSPYRSWYYFDDEEHYQSWWGIDTLPRINKEDPSYQAFITGEDGPVRHWLRAGAAGWRLDVADELPAAFLQKLVRAAKEEKPDALIIGEVWEDASNKTAYDERKNYFDGSKLDAVMNYPFREGIIRFVRYRDPYPLKRTVESILENYPPEVVHALMNHLGNHDTDRILTALAGEELGPGANREQKAMHHLDARQRRRGLALLKIAVCLQMTLPGVPCIYYGDEAETEGYNDPFNRTCFPWGKENEALQDWYRTIIRIRRSHAVYRNGSYRTLACRNAFYAFERHQGEERMITAVNLGDEEELLAYSGRWRDVLTGRTERDDISVFPGEVLLLEGE